MLYNIHAQLLQKRKRGYWELTLQVAETLFLANESVLSHRSHLERALVVIRKWNLSIVFTRLQKCVKASPVPSKNTHKWLMVDADGSSKATCVSSITWRFVWIIRPATTQPNIFFLQTGQKFRFLVTSWVSTWEMLNDVVILILFACRGHVSSTVSTDFTHGMISKHLHDALNILLPNTLYLASHIRLLRSLLVTWHQLVLRKPC